MEFVTFIVGLVIGACVGVFSTVAKISAKTLGRLRIDHSEPDEPTRMFVELKGVTPDMIAQNKYVMFEVINESYISHN